MMQVWFSLARLGDPYPLYSISNLGSIGALITYPIIIEPNFTISQTTIFWFWLYLALVLCIITNTVIVWFSLRHLQPEEGVLPEKISYSSLISFDPKQFLQWIFFSTMGSVILLSFSKYITNDIAPTPLLWVLPLSAYLFTFVLVFSKVRFYQRNFFLQTWPFVFALESISKQWLPALGIVLNLLILFELCMICHGELAASKPKVTKLPAFYLAIASGGVLGGLFIAVIAPLLFNFALERLIAIVIMALFYFLPTCNKKIGYVQ